MADPKVPIVSIANASVSGYGWMRGTVEVAGDITGPTGVEWTLEQPLNDPFGCMKGAFRITGDVVASEPDIWEAMS